MMPQNCLKIDLDPLCVLHGVFEHPFLFEKYHDHIQNVLDLAVATLCNHGIFFRWYHPIDSGAYPRSSPTDWHFTEDCSRVFSKIDFFRPCTDWTNREWSEIATFMPQSLAGLRDARASTKASCIETLIGIICSLGTNGSTLPAGNILEVKGKIWHGLMECIDSIWKFLECIGIPMPRDQFHTVFMNGLHGDGSSSL